MNEPIIKSYHRFKIQADRLFDGLKFSENSPVVVIDNEKIVDIVDKNEAGDNILKIEGILSPAFVNTHCHVELSHLKNRIPKSTGMANFLQQVVSQRNCFSEEEMVAKAQIQDEQMYQSGIAVVGDISNQAYTIRIKKKSKIDYHTFVEILGLFPEVAEQKYREGLQLRESFLKENLKATLVPHAPYSLCIDLFQKIGNTPNNPIISMHYHESQDEMDWITQHRGDLNKFYDFLQFSIPSNMVVNRNEWVKVFQKNNHFIAVHNVYATKEDIEVLQTVFQKINKHLFLCLCPNANKYIQQKMPPYFLWEKYKDMICIGTDSLASNVELNILSEIKLLQLNYPQIPLSHLLKAATYNGAQALNVDDTFGSIAIGKSAQLIVFKNVDKDKLDNAIVNRV